MIARTPASRSLDGPRGRIAWHEWGARSGRPSLLLLHATGFHGRIWDAVVEALPADIHVLAPDFAGHGGSDRPPSIADWDALADDVTELLDQAGGRVVGVGHSLGGYCLARMAATSPGRLARAVLVDPVILPPQAYDPSAPIGDAAAHPVARRRNRWDSAGAMAEAFASRPPYASWQRRVLDDYCAHGLRPATDGDGYELACPPVLEASCYMGAAHHDALSSVRAVACPVTVLRARVAERAGPLDFSVSPTWPALASAFADGRDMQWSDLSHFIPMEAPERLAALIATEVAAAGG